MHQHATLPNTIQMLALDGHVVDAVGAGQMLDGCDGDGAVGAVESFAELEVACW